VKGEKEFIALFPGVYVAELSIENPFNKERISLL